MRIDYTDHFELPLPESHRFPMDKYRRLRRQVVASDDHAQDTLHVPPAATDQQLTLCHAAAYVRAVAEGGLKPVEIRRKCQTVRLAAKHFGQVGGRVH